MDVEEKIKRFSDVVIREATLDRDSIMNRVTEEYRKTCEDYKKKTKVKYDRRFEEEINRVKRESHKDIVVAQSDLKRQLIAKRSEQIEAILSNVLEKIDKYVQTDDYLNKLIDDINKNKSKDSTVYLVDRDMKYKSAIEKATGVTVMNSTENFIGGMKLKISGSRIVDCSFKTRLEEGKKNFNKIRI